MSYRREPAERKRLMRAWVQDVKLEPESLEVKINYRLPEAVMKSVVAGGEPEGAWAEVRSSCSYSWSELTGSATELSPASWIFANSPARAPNPRQVHSRLNPG